MENSLLLPICTLKYAILNGMPIWTGESFQSKNTFPPLLNPNLLASSSICWLERERVHSVHCLHLVVLLLILFSSSAAFNIMHFINSLAS